MVRIRYNHQTKEWNTLNKEDEKSDLDITIDGKLYEVINQIKKDLRDDFDRGVLIFGDVGSGKSNLGRIICRIVSDEKFHPATHIVQDVNDIEQVIGTNAERYGAVLFDESSNIFSAVDTITKKTKYATQVLNVCRQRNLCLVIVAPYIHELKNSVAVHRTKIGLRTYIHNETQKRGRFAFYGEKKKERLYRFAKKNSGSLVGIRPKYRGQVGLDRTFTKEYRKVKDETLMKTLKSLNPNKDKPTQPTEREQLTSFNVELLKKNMDKPVKVMADLLQCTERTIKRYRKEASNQMSLKIEGIQLEKKDIGVTRDAQT